VSDEIQYPLYPHMIEVRLSLQVSLPGHRPVFIEGMVLQVDRYMYERYQEVGELDAWLHHQVVQHVLSNSTVQKVALDRGPIQ
jgi:hypothetical protein